MSRANFDGFSVNLPDGWDDVSEESGSDDLVTIACLQDGKGALQVSLAKYVAGKVPNLDRGAIEDLRDDFARTRGLGEAFSVATEENDLIVASGSYRSDEDLIRIWYVSDRVNVALVTYVCEWRFRDEETTTCDRIVRTFQFSAGD